MDYVFFGIELHNNSLNQYRMYEIELFGLNDDEAADFSALKAEYARYAELSGDDYTPESWQALQNTLTVTDAVNKSAISTQAQVDEATAALKSALGALSSVVDKSALKAEIDKEATLDLTKLTPISVADYKSALDEARALDADPIAPSRKVAEAVAKLEATKNALVPRGDKTELAAEVARAEKHVKADYEEVSWSFFEFALLQAKRTIEDENATQAQVDLDLEMLVYQTSKLRYPVISEGDDETDETEETDATKVTEAPATEAPATDAPIEDEGGCGSVMTATAVVAALVATLGAAVVVKKKD